jgi:polar amino acid transport system substrate-binding protein
LVVALPASSEALTTDRTTARSNEDSGGNIIGGEPTRITWEGTVASDEEVSALHLDLPEGSRVSENSYVRVQETILDEAAGFPRLDPDFTDDLSGEGVTISFDKPIGSGHLLHIELYHVSLPNEPGDYVIGGSYIDGRGETKALVDSPPITVIRLTFTQRIINWLDGQEWVKAWNSMLFCQIFLNPQWIVASVPALFQGWLRSLGLVLLGFPLAIPIGLGISFLRMAKLRVLRFVSSIYVNVIRGTPLFLQIYIAFFGLPLMGVRLNDYVLGIIVLAMNSSAYLAEIFRAGIQSIHKGQFEAASSLGMNGFQTMFFVIIPQTIRRVIPTATSEFILLYKDTSLLAAVGVMEQMLFAKSLVANTGVMTPYVVAACYYLVVTLPLTRIISSFERKLAASEGREAPPEDKAGKKKKRVGLFKTTAPLSATDADPALVITPEQHASR